VEFIEPEWDGQNRIQLVGDAKPLPQNARVSPQRMRNAYELTELYTALVEGRARLGPVLENHTREIIIRNEHTGRFVSLEFANRLRGRKDEAPISDPFDNAKSLGSAHPDGQQIRTMVESVEMPQ